LETVLVFSITLRQNPENQPEKRLKHFKYERVGKEILTIKIIFKWND